MRLMDLISETASNLAENLRYLRHKKGLSQQELAKRASIPRTTLTHMESGQGNPSLQNLIKVSTTIGVGIEELLSRPKTDATLIPAKEVPLKQLSGGQVNIFKLLPDSLKGFVMDRMVFAPQSRMGGHPHLPGTREYLTVLNGEMTVYISGERFTVAPGDVLAFAGNQAHSYANHGHQPTEVLSVVIPVPDENSEGK